MRSEKDKEYDRYWYAKNRDKLRLQRHEYYLENKEKIKKRAKEWSQKNKERVRQLSRESNRRNYRKNPNAFKVRKTRYALKHPIRVWATHTIINHKKRNLIAMFSGKELSRMLEDQPQPIVCRYCNISLVFNSSGKGPKPNSASLDRIDNNKDFLFDNIQILCHPCNRRKNELSHLDFLLFCQNFVKKFEEEIKQ